jgi:hypothetical protein
MKEMFALLALLSPRNKASEIALITEALMMYFSG